MKFVPGPLKVAVDRDGLSKGVDDPILVHHPDGTTTRHATVCFNGNTWLVYEPDSPLQDGTRVYIKVNCGAEVD